MLINYLFKLQCLSWEDYYDDDQQYKTISYRITRNSIEEIEIEGSTNVNIYRCLFTDCSTESNGGVLSFTKDNGKLLIEYSIFEECHSKNYGGVFYIDCESECVINNICSYKCYATNNWGQFLYASLQNDKTNYVISSSICSTYEIYGNQMPIYLQYGSQKCETVNISNYNVSTDSAIFYINANTISNITYCSFVSNNAVNWICVYLHTSSSSYIIESCNIVNNSQQNYESEGTIYCYINTEIKHSNIIDNKSKYLFYLNGFYNNNPKVTIDDTYMNYDKLWTQFLTYSVTLTTNNLKQSSTEIEFNFIECFWLKQRFMTKDKKYYIPIIVYIRTSLLPSIYI